eukprot:650662-Pyramimonas_sp.AAC.1
MRGTNVQNASYQRCKHPGFPGASSVCNVRVPWTNPIGIKGKSLGWECEYSLGIKEESLGWECEYPLCQLPQLRVFVLHCLQPELHSTTPATSRFSVDRITRIFPTLAFQWTTS